MATQSHPTESPSAPSAMPVKPPATLARFEALLRFNGRRMAGVVSTAEHQGDSER